MSSRGFSSSSVRPQCARHQSSVNRSRIEPLESRQMLAYSTTVDLGFNAAAGGLNGTGFVAALPTSKGKGFVSGNVAVAGGLLKLTSTAGDLTNNTQDDALTIDVNGAADFQVETRLTSYGFTKNYQYAGIYLGTGEDNYMNLITGFVGQPVVEFAGEAAKTFTIPAWKGITPAGIQTLDLRLTGNAAAKTVTAEYRINNTLDFGWVAVGTVSAPQVFSGSAKAGLMSTNVGSATPVQTSFDYFQLRHNPAATPPPVTPPPVTPPPVIPGKTPVTIGLNLDGLAEYSTISPFIDLSTMFRPWDASVPVNKDNYPLADASTLTYAKNYPDGIYQVSYAGQANLWFSGESANFQVTSVANGVTTGTLYLAPTSNPGTLTLGVTGVNPANPLRDLHIISPDANYAVSDTFRPVFLQKIAPFDGWLRMMDWMQTMSSPIVNWADRSSPTRFSYITGTGVPYEVIAKLANQSGKDIWVNVPVQATDDFVHNFARLFRDNLAPGRKVYVEYANELWGYIGNLPDANLSLAQARIDQQTDKTLWKTDNWGLSAQRVGKRLATISGIFKQEWGVAKWAAQSRFELGALIAASSWGDIALQYINDNYGTVRNVIDGVAVGNYTGVFTDFGPSDTPGQTLDGLFQWANHFVDTTMAGWLRGNKGVADRWQIPLNVYEGGQAFTAPDGSNFGIKQAAQFDPRMGDLYRKIITSFTQIAGTGGVWGAFSLANPYSQYGFWGALQNITDPGSVKYDAIIGMVNASV